MIIIQQDFDDKQTRGTLVLTKQGVGFKIPRGKNAPTELIPWEKMTNVFDILRNIPGFLNGHSVATKVSSSVLNADEIKAVRAALEFADDQGQLDPEQKRLLERFRDPCGLFERPEEEHGCRPDGYEEAS